MPRGGAGDAPGSDRPGEDPERQRKIRDASERTEYAAERTVLAVERTYAAWIRTGMAALVSGLAALRFMEQVLATWALVAVAVALMAFGLFSFAAAAWRFWRQGGSVDVSDIPRLRPSLVWLATGLLMVASLIGIGSALMLLPHARAVLTP